MEGESILNKTTGKIDSLLHDLIAPHYLLTALLIVVLLIVIYMQWGKSEGFALHADRKMLSLGPTSTMAFQELSSAGMEGMSNRGVGVNEVDPSQVGRSGGVNPYSVYMDPALKCTSGDVLLDSDDPYAYTAEVLKQEVAQGKTEGMQGRKALGTGQERITMNTGRMF